MSSVEATLTEILEEARRRGFLGPGEVAPHIAHARGFVAAVEDALGDPPARFCDLGTGGGVPGLVLATSWPAATGILVESNARRGQALREATDVLGVAGRIQVIEERAETAAHLPDARESFPAVVARSFAEPAATAEIAAGFVRVGGVLVVSEPPGGQAERWPTASLADLGFAPVRIRVGKQGTFAVLHKERSTADDVPRRVGRPTKRPLW